MVGIKGVSKKLVDCTDSLVLGFFEEKAKEFQIPLKVLLYLTFSKNKEIITNLVHSHILEGDEKKLAEIGFHYEAQLNQFRPDL